MLYEVITILAVDGQYIENFQKILPTVVLDKAHTITVDRNREKVDIEITDDHLVPLIKGQVDISPRYLFDCSVAKVVKDSPAAEAGLQKGDEFVSVDGQTFQFYDA